jgi:hypothetical protein
MSANTSSAAIQRYKNKVYKRIVADLDKDLVAQWEKKLSEKGISKQQFIRNAITQFLEAGD